MTINESDNSLDPSGTKVIILPSDCSNSNARLLAIALLNPRTLCPQKFLMDDKTYQLYELKQFNYQNPHLMKNNVATMRDGQVVKSLIFSNDNDGIVLEKPEFLIATKFNFVYILISFYERILEGLLEPCGDDDEGEQTGRRSRSRLLNIDDLLEYLEDDSMFLQNIPRKFFNEDNVIVMKAIDAVFEIVEENDEKYYKLKPELILNYLQQKVISVVNTTFPESILQKAIIEKLTPPPEIGKPAETIADDVIYAAKIHHAINIVSSYISPLLTAKLHERNASHLGKLQQHQKKLRMIAERQRLAEDNLQELNTNLLVEKKRVMNSKTATTTTTTKKKTVVKAKVQVGKGALDGFFKKA